jgi:hypothetical protein
LNRAPTWARFNSEASSFCPGHDPADRIAGSGPHVRHRTDGTAASASNGVQAIPYERKYMSLGMIVLIVVVLVLVGVLPTWPHSRSWGGAPSGIVGVILLVVIVLFLMGKI